MIKSMTGYGKASVALADKVLNVELKSLNSKQLDLNLRLPQSLKDKELLIRNLVAAELDRGKVDLIVWFEGESEKNLQINEAIVARLFAQMQRLSQQLGAQTPDSQLLQMVLQLPDVLENERAQSSDTDWAACQQALQQALAQMQAFRQQEGQALRADLAKRIGIIQQKALEVLPLEPEREVAVRQRLQTALGNLGTEPNIDKDRFEQEVLYYLDKYDITEEKVRLANHCSYFLQSIDEDSAGKKLGFIAQEIGREVNTLGSKANHTQIQHLVVQMKEELEKIKEQSLNIL